MPAAEHDGTLQGRRLETRTREERVRAAAVARDYRGDVTLVLEDGRRLTGYVFSHDESGASPHVRLVTAGSDEKVTVSLADVAAIEMSGSDKADGRSWRAWVERHEEGKRLRAQGLQPAEYEPQPEPLDEA